MRKIALALAALIALIAPAVAQVNPQNVPANSVVGRLGIGTGPTQAIPFATLGTLLSSGLSNPSSPACTRMWPTSNFIGNWNVIDAYGNTVSTAGSTSQGLQEAINFSINNGQCLQVYGQGTLALGSQTATLNSTTTVTGLTSTANLLPGDYVVAAAGGIPFFTKISSVDSSTQIHLSNAATVTASRTLTFTRSAGGNRASQITASATVQIPPVEQWSFQAYDVNLTCTAGVNGPCLQFDSAIIVDFNWMGQLVYQPGTPTVNSVAVLVAPVNPVPLDGIIGFGTNRVFIGNFASPANGVAEAVLGFNLAGGSVLNNYFSSVELNGTGSGATANTNYGVKVFNATASTSFEQNIIDIADIHLVLGAGLQLGVSTTNAANIRHNIWRIGGIRPSGASSAGISSFGSYDTFEIGGITNEEGTLLQGINLQSSANGNKVSYGQIIGAGTALIDGGTCNSWAGANGTKIAEYGTTSGCTTVVPAAVASGTLTLPAATDTLVGKATTDTLTNKAYDTAGAGNSFLINGLAATANTGTGSVVRATSPTLVTPVLGAATGTSLDGAVIGGVTPAAVTATTLLGKAGNSASNVRAPGQLTAQVSATGNGADITEDTLQTFSLPANTLDAVGRGVRIKAWGSLANNGDGKTVKIYFGVQAYTSTSLTISNVGWTAWVDVFKTGSNTQTAIGTGIFSNTVPGTQSTSPNQTDTSAITIKVTGQATVANANDIICNGMTVDVIN